MSTEQNKAIVRQLIEEVINQNNLSLGEQLIAADIIEHEDDAAAWRDAHRWIK